MLSNGKAISVGASLVTINSVQSVLGLDSYGFYFYELLLMMTKKGRMLDPPPQILDTKSWFV